jgi:hypothetical protein
MPIINNPEPMNTCSNCGPQLLDFFNWGIHLGAFFESDATRIITIYEPDPNEWTDNRKRR